MNGWITLPELALLPPDQQALTLAAAVFDLVLLQITLALNGPLPAALLLMRARVRLSPDGTEIWVRAPEGQAAS